MKPSILFVSDLIFWPPNGGEKLRASHILDSLSRCFEVTVLAPLPPPDCPLLGQIKSWQPLPAGYTSFRARLLGSFNLLWQRPEWHHLLVNICQQAKPQVAWFDYGHWGQYARLVQSYGAAAVMDTHNAQSRLTRQGWHSRPFGRMHWYYGLHLPLEQWHERHLFPHFDRIVSVSEEDRGFHARFVGAENSLYLPNYLDEPSYQLEKPVQRDENLIIMTGNFTAFQNQAGARWFASEVWPRVCAHRPAARWLMVGHASAAWKQEMQTVPSALCTGSVPSVTPYLRQAALSVTPLLHGSGSRFKILEALAGETPLAGTPLSAEGLAMEHGKHALLASSADALVQSILYLLDHPEERQRLAQNGLALFRQEYSMEVNTSRLQQIILDMVEKKP